MSDLDTLELRVDPLQAKERGFNDFNFFAGLCLGDIMRFPFPPFYLSLHLLVVKAIKEGRDDKLYKIIRYAVGLPRGFTKTTFLKVLVCWLIAYEKITFLLIVCATEPLAYSFLSDVSTMLGSDNMQAVYGIWEPAVDSASAKKGSYRRRLIILKAIGSGSSIRGVNEDNRRPDFLLCDDMQTKENDESETESEAMFVWFVGTLLKVVDKFFSIVFYVGNMYSDHCILYKLKESPIWISLITGALLADETSIWPELQSVEDLYEGFVHDESLGHADIWFAEIMNDPINSKTSLLKGAFPTMPLSVIPAPDASFLTIDPANFRNSSDDNVICSHHIIDGTGYVNELDGGIWNPKKTALNAIDMAVRTDATLIAVEAYGYQESLAFWMSEIIREEKITGIEVIPITRRLNRTKEQHIRNFIAEIYSGHWYFLHDIDRIKFVYQATAYRVGKIKNKDDYLDCPAMGIEVRNQFAHLLSVRRVPFAQKARVLGNNTPF